MGRHRRAAEKRGETVRVEKILDENISATAAVDAVLVDWARRNPRVDDAPCCASCAGGGPCSSG